MNTHHQESSQAVLAMVKYCLSAIDKLDKSSLDEQVRRVSRAGSYTEKAQRKTFWHQIKSEDLAKVWDDLQGYLTSHGLSRSAAESIKINVQASQKGLFADDITEVATNGQLRVVRVQVVSYGYAHDQVDKMTIGVSFEAYHFHVGFLRTLTLLWGPNRSGMLKLLGNVAEYNTYLAIATKAVMQAGQTLSDDMIVKVTTKGLIDLP